MDRTTLTHYALIVVVTLVLAVMLAFSGAMGEVIGDMFSNTFHSVIGVNDKANEIIIDDSHILDEKYPDTTIEV